MKNDLLDTLPQEIRENLMWRTSADEPFTAYRDHVRSAADDVLYHRGRLNSPINNVEDIAVTSQMEDMIGAIMKKMGFQKKLWNNGGNPKTGRDGGQAQGAGGEDRRQRKPRCANCSSEKHTAAECDKPKVPFEKRLCHKCGKSGHTAVQCRSGGRPAGSLEDEQGNWPDDYFGCLAQGESNINTVGH